MQDSMATIAITTRQRKLLNQDSGDGAKTIMFMPTSGSCRCAAAQSSGSEPFTKCPPQHFRLRQNLLTWSGPLRDLTIDFPKICCSAGSSFGGHIHSCSFHQVKRSVSAVVSRSRKGPRFNFLAGSLIIARCLSEVFSLGRRATATRLA